MKDFYKINDNETIPFYCSLHYKSLAKEYNDFIQQMDVFLSNNEKEDKKNIKILDSSLINDKKDVKIVKFNKNFKKKIIFNSIKIEKKNNFNVVSNNFDNDDKNKNKIVDNKLIIKKSLIEGKNIFTAKTTINNNNNNNKNIFTSVINKQKENEKKDLQINKNENNNFSNENNNNNNENKENKDNNLINNNNNNDNEKTKENEKIKKIFLDENLFEAFAENNKNNMEPRIFHKIIF